MKLLLLGGTGEARELARMLHGSPGSAGSHLEVVSSLAGRVANPLKPVGAVRVGGFGGVEGLVRYLLAEGVDLVVDATHPFAATMSEHAAAACSQARVPLMALRRPGWTERPGDRWVRVPSLEAAADVLPSVGSRCLLTIGRQGVGAFAQVTGVHFVVRAIDPPDVLPPDASLLLTRGPFALADEVELMRSRGIEVVVTKDSGGPMTSAKLDAACELGVPVVVIDRPRYPTFADGTPVPVVTTATEAASCISTL